MALAILAADDIALTVHGTARVLEEPVVAGVVGVAIEAEGVQDHRRPAFAIEAGVRWRWTDPDAADRDAAVRSALERIAERGDID